MIDQWLSSVLEASLHNRFSNKDLTKLKNFYMAQQALSRELQAAKQLGICKTTTLEDVVGVNPNATNGTNAGSKEMSS